MKMSTPRQPPSGSVICTHQSDLVLALNSVVQENMSFISMGVFAMGDLLKALLYHLMLS